jgi:hypothetical protein
MVESTIIDDLFDLDITPESFVIKWSRIGSLNQVSIFKQFISANANAHKFMQGMRDMFIMCLGYKNGDTFEDDIKNVTLSSMYIAKKWKCSDSTVRARRKEVGVTMPVGRTKLHFQEYDRYPVMSV